VAFELLHHGGQVGPPGIEGGREKGVAVPIYLKKLELLGWKKADTGLVSGGEAKKETCILGCGGVNGPA